MDTIMRCYWTCRDKNKEKSPQMLKKKVLFQRNNPRIHTYAVLMQKIDDLKL